MIIIKDSGTDGKLYYGSQMAEIYLNGLKNEKIMTTEMLFPVVVEYTKEETLKIKRI